MSLEDKFAYWIDLGLTSYENAYELQKKLVQMRSRNLVPDIILATQHFDQVNFGTSKDHNKFSDEFLHSVALRYGNSSFDNVKKVLEEMNIGFCESDRGGGACLFSPGQFVYYPIVDHTKITGKDIDVSSYKGKIYSTIFETLYGLGVQGVKLTSDHSYATREDRKDAWIEREGRALKMGSKGIRISGKIAYHGFALYIDKAGTQKFGIVKPCGYNANEVQITSVEEELGRSIDPRQVHDLVKKGLTRNFSYNVIRELDITKFNSLLMQGAAAV